MSRHRPARSTVIVVSSVLLATLGVVGGIYGIGSVGTSRPSDAPPPASATVAPAVARSVDLPNAIPARSTGNALLDVVLKPSAGNNASIVENQVPLSLDMQSPPPPVNEDPAPPKP